MAGGGGERASPRKRSGPEGGSSRPLTAKRKYVFGVGHTRLNVYLQAGYCFGGYDFFVSPISNRFRGGCHGFGQTYFRRSAALCFEVPRHLYAATCEWRSASTVPTGLGTGWLRDPALKVLGYFHLPLRGKGVPMSLDVVPFQSSPNYAWNHKTHEIHERNQEYRKKPVDALSVSFCMQSILS